MTKRDKKTKTKSLPDVKNCRVIGIGVENFAECTEWRAISCSHALPFGYCYLCMHPRVDEMIENTKKALLAEKL